MRPIALVGVVLILLDADVPGQYVGDEPVGHRMLLVQQPHHVSLSDEKDRAPCSRRCAPHPDRLTRQTALAEELAWAEHRDHRLPAGF